MSPIDLTAEWSAMKQALCGVCYLDITTPNPVGFYQSSSSLPPDVETIAEALPVMRDEFDALIAERTCQEIHLGCQMQWSKASCGMLRLPARLVLADGTTERVYAGLFGGGDDESYVGDYRFWERLVKATGRTGREAWEPVIEALGLETEPPDEPRFWYPDIFRDVMLRLLGEELGLPGQGLVRSPEPGPDIVSWDGEVAKSHRWTMLSEEPSLNSAVTNGAVSP